MATQTVGKVVRELAANGKLFTVFELLKAADATPDTAIQVLSQQYRSGHIIRYGPVVHPFGPPDFARMGAQIVHAGVHGPHSFITPNGEFHALTHKEVRKKQMEGQEEYADLGHPGRKEGTDRDDMLPWINESEDIHALERRVVSLQDQLAQALDTIERLSLIPSDNTVSLEDLAVMLESRLYPLLEQRLQESAMDPNKIRSLMAKALSGSP